MKTICVLLITSVIGLGLLATTSRTLPDGKPRKALTKPAPGLKRYLYVVTPGVRNYLGYGGHGIHVFDIDNALCTLAQLGGSDLHLMVTYPDRFPAS